MVHANSHQILALDLLTQLRDQKDLSEITPFWTQMNSKEREEFAAVLFHESKNLAEKKEPYPFQALELTKRIAPLSAKIQFLLAHFFFRYAVRHKSDQHLLYAEKQIQHAIEIKSHFFDAWYIWGDILVHLGLVYHEPAYFFKAHEKYAKANLLAKDQPKQLKKFMWDWALCWTHLARNSNEPQDYKKALQKFQKTEELGCIEPDFYVDYANAWSLLGACTKDPRFLNKALPLFEKAIELKESCFSAWLGLAHTYQSLYHHHQKSDLLAQAHTSYGKAAELKSEHFDLWMQWGNLFLESGRVHKEVKHLQMSAMKFAKALKIKPEDSEALSQWAEALTLLGAYTARLDHLKEAQVKLQAALEISRECPNVWTRLGNCLSALGQYFDDAEYYQSALEKYQQALKLDKQHFFALKGLANAQFYLGDVHRDKLLLKEAANYFEHGFNTQKYPAEMANQWGMTLMRLAELLDHQGIVEQAIDKFEKGIKALNKEKELATSLYFNYACALDYLATYTEDASLYEKAAILLEKVIQMDADYTPAYYNLALVYAHLAELVEEIDFYNQSNDAFYKAIQEDPEDEVIWNAWGVMLTQYAKLIYDPLKIDLYEQLIQDAEKKLRQSLQLGCLDALYNLACLRCLTGDLEEAMQYLMLSHQKEVLPSIEHLMYDDALESLRQTALFQDFVQNQLQRNDLLDN